MSALDNNAIPEDAPERPRGRIITFYSYKGGTGRSMAVANVAWILASNGRRVLVIDWDLEAPGLHRYFRPFLANPEMTETPGLIDCFVHFVEAAGLQASRPNDVSSADHPWFYNQADLLRYSEPLEYDFPGGGLIDFVSAGQQGPSYAARVNTFQWGEFYEKLGGGVFLEAMKARLRKDYEFVLIDSRTGLSDTSGICTVQMPDELVVCFTLNRQSIFGTAATATSADLQRRRADGTQGLRIWPVPMRIDLSEKERLEAARMTAREKFAPFLWHIPIARRSEYWDSVETLYFPYYAYEEVLATIADTPGSTKSLLNAMERITEHLTSDLKSGKIVAMPALAREVRAQLLTHYQPAVPVTAAPQKKSPRFYISYAKAEEATPLVSKLADEISARFGPRSVFWDEKVPFGAKWEVTLSRELENADTVIIVMGPSWSNLLGNFEMSRALALGKLIIPMRIRGALWQQMPSELRDIRGVEIRDSSIAEDLKSFVDLLSESLPREILSEAAIPTHLDDPQKGKWGGRSEVSGRRLTAQVRPATEDWFQISLRIDSVEPPALEGSVEFHLHPSFHPSVVQVPANKGHAILKLIGWGAFTVGVAADEGRTRLELDLTELLDAPARFRER